MFNEIQYMITYCKERNIATDLRILNHNSMKMMTMNIFETIVGDNQSNVAVGNAHFKND